MGQPVASLIALTQAMHDRKDNSEVLQHALYPVQIIAGKDDKIIPPDSLEYLAKLPNLFSFVAYDGVAHMSMVEAPDLLIRDLSLFIDRCYKS